jgi:predicted secreted Zn-dependent protease
VALLYQSPAVVATQALYSARELTVATRFLTRMLVLVLCALAVAAATLRFVSLAEATKVVTPPLPVTRKAATVRLVPATAPTPASSVVAAPTCAPFGAVRSPSPLTMTTPGLQQLIDAPTSYRVYGNTNAVVASELRRCAPVSTDGSFSATTSYWLGAHYGYSLTPTGACQLSDITVAVHVSQTLPSWQDNDSGDLAEKWAAYEHSLVMHENGHTIIDISQAGILLEELSGLPALPCDQIGAAAGTMMTARLAALDKANDDYDATTRHGAAQGANW